MGQQQLLLIILGVIIVGIAIAVGISQFGAHSVQANKDGLTSGLVNLAANAYQHKIRPCTMGGGGGTYDGSNCTPVSPYSIPTKMQKDDNGAYTRPSISATTITLVGTSSLGGQYTATCVVDSLGNNAIIFSASW
ncbi:MAG: hypothetical protein QME52_06670 [Bacteroidota bacterium]|nr:hypothetical protein [Bacteroidota bacterium]